MSVVRSDHLVKSLVTFLRVELGQTLTYTISPDVLALFNYLGSDGCDKKSSLYNNFAQEQICSALVPVMLDKATTMFISGRSCPMYSSSYSAMQFVDPIQHVYARLILSFALSESPNNAL